MRNLYRYAMLFTLLACINLSACQPTPDTPKQVSDKYWRALETGDISSAKKLVSTNSQADLDTYLTLPPEQKLPLIGVISGEQYATVHTTITGQTTNTQSVSSDTEPNSTFDTILILEDGHWKIDVTRTLVPIPEQPVTTPDNQKSEALQENLNAINETLKEGAEMLNEFMQEGSKDMSESLLKGMNKMNESLRDAIDKMKQRRQQQNSPQKPANENDGKTDEGLI